MTIDKNDLLNSILASIERIDYVKSADIPNIDLYMDQVTTFMDEKLQSTTRNPGEDKILTKTMINNYAKNNLLPPPEKKKYTKDAPKEKERIDTLHERNLFKLQMMPMFEPKM